VAGSDISGDKFYILFRNAVLQSSINSVIPFTRFPFEVRGTDDGQSVKRYGETEFKKLFRKLLAQREHLMKGGHVVECSMLQVIQEKEQLTGRDYLTDSFIRVGDFEFQRFEGTWRFTGAYLE